MSTVDSNDVRARLDAVVAAMKQSGAWDTPQPNPNAFVDMGAFGMKTMTFCQWLRYVFVPNVEKLITSAGPWPARSMVALPAVREGDTDPAIDALVPALQEFDELFQSDE